MGTETSLSFPALLLVRADLVDRWATVCSVHRPTTRRSSTSLDVGLYDLRRVTDTTKTPDDDTVRDLVGLHSADKRSNVAGLPVARR